jgi:hypothetical protein
MSVEHGKCHCGQTEWEVKLEERAHILCHCDTCKLLGGGTYSLNQIVPKDNIKITKGDVKTYTYYGDSGLFDCLQIEELLLTESQATQSTAITARTAQATFTTIKP